MEKWTLNVEGKSETINNPSWEQIYQVLKRIDGEECTQADLTLIGTGSLMVCGGDLEEDKRIYAVEYYPEDDQLGTSQLVNPHVTPNDEYLYITVEQIGIDFPAEYCIEFSDVVEAFKHFFEKGKLSSDLIWE
ncbi:Imm1 family immunity protein [Shimazuella sp. AN120528]|uniref:Imm1 family immunity protein n=1 Tax=Shimazuella soli TaxID=1892854 RepID=UPI001F1114EA|nr:Imm1 family immunity protein [Shimazuella soli]MCH5584192.1 Imm1 family immunity protein [Shimazuella soli]